MIQYESVKFNRVCVMCEYTDSLPNDRKPQDGGVYCYENISLFCDIVLLLKMRFVKPAGLLICNIDL